jgi:peptide-methionine (R)-S-oxide reductase
MMYSKLALIFTAALVLWDSGKVTHSDDEWRSILGTERYCVMRRKATERAFSGQYLYWTVDGAYHCAACHLALFHSSSKYDAHNGWPNFHEPIAQKHVWIKEDHSLPFCRYEVLCRACDSHLGHVFRESPDTLRYTINSIALEFQEGE